MIMKGATIAAGDVAAAETAAELNLDAKEPTSQCLPAPLLLRSILLVPVMELEAFPGALPRWRRLARRV